MKRLIRRDAIFFFIFNLIWFQLSPTAPTTRINFVFKLNFKVSFNSLLNKLKKTCYLKTITNLRIEFFPSFNFKLRAINFPNKILSVEIYWKYHLLRVISSYITSKLCNSNELKILDLYIITSSIKKIYLVLY